MLSRVAGSLYWMGRYLERAENVARLLQVTAETSLEFEGLDEKLAQAEWDDLLAALPGAQVQGIDASSPARETLSYTRELLLAQQNPLSVRHSLGMARENGRGVREALTREVFLELNEAYHELEALRRKALRSPVAARDAVTATHRSILTALGAMEHTLSRDQGWTFLKLGEAMERTQRTLLVLRVKLPGLRRLPESTELPLFYARWRALLRCVASLENFRRLHGAALEPDQVVRFLLFDALAPRSVRCGVSRIKHYLDQLPAEASSPLSRSAGKLLARLSYEDDAIMAADLAPFCNATVEALAKLHRSIGLQYFPV